MAKLCAQNLSYLDWQGLDLDVDEMEILSVFGNSGSGKSLLLRALADLIPWSGSIALDGVSALDFEPSLWRKQVAYIPAEILWWHDSVSEHFENAVSEASLEKLSLTKDALSWSPSRLSMGERQRLGFLRALDRSPKVLLLDEPTANLDSGSAAVVEGLVVDYLRQHSACCIWVSHNEAQLDRVGNRVFRMEDKQLKEVSR